MQAQTHDTIAHRRLGKTDLSRRIAQLAAELEQARERLHETQRAVHNAGQVLTIARVERHLAAMEVAELADRLERLQEMQEMQGNSANERESTLGDARLS